MATSFASPGKSQQSHHRRNRASTQGLVFGMVILLAVIGVWIAMQLYVGSLEDKNEKLVNDIETAHEQYDAAQVSETIDFYERLEILDHVNAENDNVTVEVLSDLEKVIVPRVVLSGVSLSRAEDGAHMIEMEGDAEAFDLLAQQELSLRNSGLFTDIVVGDTGLTEEGRIDFSMEAIYSGGTEQE